MNAWAIWISALTGVVSIAGAGLMGAWAAERRLDRLQKRELRELRRSMREDRPAADEEGDGR